jgi:crotonobetainyl-CoA:carnitine CoA-transferase CaiB-like acyl-CoA transferase
VKDERSWGGHSFYNLYETADRRWVVLCAVEAKFVRNLLAALGREDLIPVATQPPGSAHAPVKAFLAATFRTRSRDEWEAWMQTRDVAFAPVLDLHEAFQRPQVAARGMLLRDAEGNLHIGNPIRFRDEPPRIDTRLPALGEHTGEVLAALAARERH